MKSFRKGQFEKKPDVCMITCSIDNGEVIKQWGSKFLKD